MTLLCWFHRSALCASLVVCTLGIAAPVSASLLGSDYNGNIFDINQSTGAATNSRFTGITNLAGIAYNSSGTLFGLSTFSSSAPANSLFRINPSTGAFTLVGSTGLTSIFEGDLAFNPTTGVLYGLENLSSTNALQLFTLNTTTGAATIVGSINTTLGDLSAMAFDGAGNLYVIDTNNSNLLTVNKANGTVLSTVPLSRALGFTAGMAFDPMTGTLYVADGNTNGTNDLYTLNPATGILSLVGPTGVSDGLAGLTFSPGSTSPVPEPATIGLLLLGAVTFLRRSLSLCSRES